jgi:hypothetical protein
MAKQTKQKPTHTDLCVKLFEDHVTKLIDLLASGEATVHDRKVINEFLKNNNITCEPRIAAPPEELEICPFSEDDMPEHYLKLLKR